MAKGVVLVTAALVITFAGLYVLLPPSPILPVVSSLAGLVVALFLVRRGHAPASAVFGALALVVILLSALVLFLTRPISTGAVASDPLAQEIDALLKSNSFSGAVLIAQENDVLLAKGYGYADRSRMIANTPETRFRVGSVTKQFTAMAVLLLHARGQLDVQDGICNYLPNCPQAWQEITIHHLLTHSSGMADYLPGCLSSKEQVREIIRREENQPLVFEPGTRFSYSNIGYRVLAEIVERAAEQAYGDFLRDNIFEPLHMARTAFEPGVAPNLAAGYTNNLLPVCPADVSLMYGEGGINSTVEDLYLWDRALGTETLIPRSLLESMFTPYVPMETYPNFIGGAGYGWAIGRQGGHLVQMHGGFIFGYTSAVARFPDDQMTLIISSNQQNYDESIYSLVSSKLFGKQR